MYHGHDYPEISPLSTPDLPQVSMTIEESVHYPLLGADSDDQWFSLTSESYGYVRLGPENRMFVLTVYHHMHCMRKLEVALLDRRDKISTFHHALHCLNYLRQGFICAAHEGLEEDDWMRGWGREDWELLGFEERPEGGYGEDGEGFKKGKIRGELVCEDWDLAYDEFDKNHERFVEWRNEWN